MEKLQSRRTFLRAAGAAGAAWAVADLLQVEAALAWAAQQANTEGPRVLAALTQAQADVIDAMTSRILPSVDGRPGAHEAGVLFFIDRSLSTFNTAGKKLYASGITDLNRRASRLWKGTASFAALTTPRQVELLHAIEKTPFFEAVRFDTIVGTFALLTWGGNRDHMGWHMLGLDHQPAYQAPFGYYDADVNRRS
jgi:hypothetical protein